MVYKKYFLLIIRGNKFC